MIKYLEIVDKIKDVKEDVFNNFNEKVSIPLVLSNMDSLVKESDGTIIIQKDNFEIELTSETRVAFSEIISILKKIEIDLYNKIDYKYIDFFEKFKNINYKTDLDNENTEFDSVILNSLTLEILTIFNLKFWCNNDFERKEFLEEFDNSKIESEDEDIDLLEENIDIIEENNENLQIIKNNWWLNLLNKIRNLKKGIQK